MREFEIIKNACAQALTEENDSEKGSTRFYSVVDPESVLELVTLVEASITPHELETLTVLIRNLTNYVEATNDDKNNASLPDRDDLIRQAKYVLSIYAR